MTDETPAPPVRTRKPRGQGHERRPEILAAAKALFIADGYEAFTTRKLASRVGLSQTGLYVYFKSKEELFDALCRQSFGQLAAEFLQAEPHLGEGLDRLRALGRAYIDFGLTHPDEYRLTFMEGPGLLMKPGHDPQIDLRRPFEEQSIGNQVFLIIGRNLKRLADEGLLREMDLSVMTHTVFFALHGLVSLFIARPGFVKSPRQPLIDSSLETLVEGLRVHAR